MNDILYGLDVLHPNDDDAVEVRGISGTGQTVSGYYKDREKLVRDIQAYGGYTWYCVMNTFDEACYARQQCERLVERPKSTTSDSEITCIDWILVDCDPERAKGVSSTDEEKKSARDVINRVYKYLAGQGFSKPVGADSGNGYHLLYRVKIPIVKFPEAVATIKTFLKVLDVLFSDEHAKIDTAVFNPARITKLYGTVAHKGSNLKTRPHRQSKILMADDPVALTSYSLIEKVAKEWHEPVRPTDRRRNLNSKFDPREFLLQHGVNITKETPYSGGTKLVLEACPFDGNHKAPDSAVFVHDDGTIGFKCFHNSCSEHGWRDVRKLLDPAAYERTNDTFRTQEPYRVITTSAPAEPEPEQTENHFLRMRDIKPIDRSKIVAIPSGFAELDRKIIGFNKGEMSVWSGENGSGKSTLLNQQILESIQRGFRVAVFSGELTDRRVKNWLYLQAAGRSGITQSSNGKTWYVSREISDAIDDWMDDRVWLYNNAYGNKVDSLMRDFERHLQEHPTDVVILDNLMSISYAQGQGKYDAQTDIVLRLSAMCKKYDVHIHFVCHPRKPSGFLRKYDISGTADITNAADNIFMVHRVNKDFQRGATEFFGKVEAAEYGKFSNVVEIMKNRDLGVEGELVGLYFDVPTKQFQDERNQNRGYGWLDKYSDCPF